VRHAVRVAYTFQPIALETLGPINESAAQFLNDLGYRIIYVSAADKEGQLILQLISVALQRFDAILLYESFRNDDNPDLESSSSI